MNRAALLACLLFLAGCPAQPPAKTAKTGEGPKPTQREQAKAAAQALGKQLKQRLGKALTEGGPKGGIEACKVAAPEIAGKVSQAQGVKIGRTSFKLRNPKNAPPAWAKAWVDARAAEPKFANAEDGTLRALLPIKLDALCTTCHGAEDLLSQDVREALAKHYPQDQATGFAKGDLRGWFWVEVPPVN